MKLADLKALDFKLPNLPKPVMISLIVMGGCIVLFVILQLTLNAALGEAVNDVTRLKAELSKIQVALKQSKEDIEFINKNQDRFNALMESQKLIPHTRRTAVRQMQDLASEFGITSLNYNFQAAGAQSPDAAAQQAKSDLYKVYVENIELKIGAPLDGSIYSFIAGMHDDFPGSMVLTEVELARALVISPDMLEKAGKGEDSGLVTGTLKYSWRTAQQNKQDEKK
jgi:hypothetical protein